MPDPGTLRLFLVRHGEVAANRQLTFVGRGDDPLTQKGRRQAAALGKTFRGIPVDRVVCSPLERCVATGRRIAVATGCAVVTDERIIEQSFGDWEGLTPADIEKRGSGDGERFRLWRQDPSGSPPGGESLLTVQRRATELVTDLVASGSASTVLVSHVSPIKALVCHALGLPLTQVGRFFLDPASITVVDWSSSPVLRVMNAHAQMDWNQAGWLGERM